MSERRLRLPISGMTCASCVSHVEDALKQTEGILDSSVNLASESASVLMAEEKLPQAIRAIRSAGYNVLQDTLRFSIGGMTCASCVNHVEQAIEELPGVLDARVNLATDRAEVDTVLGLVTTADILRVVQNAGYDAALVGDSRDREQEARTREQARLGRRLIAGVLFSTLTLVGSFAGMLGLPGWVSSNSLLLVLATPVQFWVGWQFYRGAWGALRHRTADMNTLVAIGTSVAYFFSFFVTIFPQVLEASGIPAATYFDTSAVIITLVLLGKFLEAKAKGRTSDAIRRLLSLQPPDATVLRNEQEMQIPVEEVRVGDLILVRPGERVPVDGTILEGSSYLDESMVTGESIPIFKQIGSPVVGATINGLGAFRFRAERVGKDTFLAQVVKMVEEAQGSKAPVQRLADKIVAVFVPVVLGVALITFVVWWAWGPTPSYLVALNNMVAVLVIACPCAMGLATPTAVMVGTGRGAQAGILIRSGEALEKAERVNLVVFDKTGTLTMGKPSVSQIITTAGSEKEVLLLAAAAERYSEHPLALAVVEEAKRQSLSIPDGSDFQAIPGRGVTVHLEGGEVVVGNAEFLLEKGLASLERKYEEEGYTVIYVARNGTWIGALLISDAPKDGARETVEKLSRRGLQVLMLTGDTETSARSVARTLGISEVLAQVLPSQKAAKIKQLQANGKCVAMVGDGINDAPALAQADLGIALGTGTDIALETADMALISGDLLGVPRALTLSKKTMTTIRWNLFWAFIYNVLGIPIAAGVLYPAFGLLLNPMIGALAMAFSSVFVVTNSLRLRKARI
ncbi:MAG: heavy metal translocating P-type ATPase [Coprothermobacterota bacterium]|nr:heavy metal translocating P-type ATPase [Coprothermobacterota bacterium]